MLLGSALFIGVYLAAGCSVAAGSWESVRRRHDTFPKTVAGVACLALYEAARWPLTLFGK